MMKGLTLQQLAAKIEGQKALKKDYIADTAGMKIILDGIANTPKLVIPKQGEFNILSTGHDQIAAKVDVPRKYYARMLEKSPALLANNINTWFKLEPEKRMVRTLGPDMRALLSSRYQRIENESIVEAIMPILMGIPDVKIVSCEVTERRLYIQAVAPRVQGEVKKGDVIQSGVVISNSEIGYGAVTVANMDWRLICLNGAISASKFRAYHIGRNIEDNAALWGEDTVQADDRAVLLKARDMVKAAVDENLFRQRIEKMQGLTQIKVEGDPAEAVEVLSQKIGVSDDEKGGILRSLIEGADLSAWGVLNAVTHQAHTARSYDRAVEFEMAGGKLLELSRKDWKEVLEAA
jgi:hypothetical protein